MCTDETERLCGVIPTRQLLTASLDASWKKLVIRRVVALPATATVLEACELFVLTSVFAFPVIDGERRVVGVVDVGLFRQEMLEAETAEESVVKPPGDDFFEALVSSRRCARRVALRVFRYRFPGCSRPWAAERSARC